VTATLVIQIASASVLGVGFLGVINEFTETYLGFSFVKPFQKLGQYLKDKFKKDPNKKINRYEKLGPDFDYVPVEIEHESKDSKEEVTVGKVEVIDANSAYTDPKNHRFDSLMDTNLKDLQIKMQALHEQDLKSADEKKHTRKSHEFMLSLLQQEGARTAHLGSGHVKNKVLTELRTAIDKKPTEYLPNPAIIVSQIIENGDHSLVRVLNEIADRKDASLDSLTATIISNLTDQNVDFTLANFKMAVNIEAERIKFENSINPHAVKNILDKAAEEKDFSMQKLTTSRLKDTGGMQKTLVLANQYCSFFGDSKAEDSKHSDLSIELDDLRRQTL
jgi:hypothetical protein